MPRSSDGEFELVLGNKQLLSLFFLVVVLFAVFFSLGYMVGKSVSPVPSMAAQPAETPAGGAATPAAPSSLQEPAKETPSVAAPAAEQPSAAPPIETQPARTQTVAASAPPAAPAATPLATRPAAPAGAGEGNLGTSAAVTAGEIHLQVAAVRVKADAAALAEVLRKKGYAVSLNEETSDGWYRVLVGPFASDKDAQEARARLENDGYKSIVKKP